MANFSTKRMNKPLREGQRTSRRSDTVDDSDSSSADDNLPYQKSRKRTSKYPSGMRLSRTSAAKARKRGDTSPEDGDDEEGEEADEASDDEEDVLALPVGSTNKRGHQTGLSIELSNTSLGKRGRSPASDDAGERPMSKMSKIDSEIETSDDDDAYNAVDDISDSEEEEDFERNEEQQIVNDEEAYGVKHGKRGSVSSVGSFFGMLEEDGDDSIFPDVPTFFDDQMEQTEITRRGSILRENTDDAPTTRRVRFAEEVQNFGSSSSTTESEDEAQIYPDLFLQQDALDPGFRKLIERNDPDLSDEGSYWDFESDGRVIEELEDDESGSETGSSGYETDEGETTDEDSFFLQSVKNPQVLHARSNARPSVSATPVTTPVRRALANARRGPVMGTFVADKTKPFAVVSGQGTHLLFYPPTETRQSGSPSRIDASSPGTSLVPTQAQCEKESEIGFNHADPMLSSPANAMHNGIFGNRPSSAVSSMSTQIVGPTEAFYPFVSLDCNGEVETDEVDFFDDLSADEDLNIEDFINFGDQSSDEDNQDPPQEQEDPSSNSTTFEEERDQGKAPQSNARFPPVKPRHGHAQTPSKSDSLLSHFDKGVASSFRRNADRHKSWTRSPIGAGIKGGRFDTANIPISPLRRRKGMPGAGAMPPPPRMQPAPPTTPIRNPPNTFGGPIKKRIQNSNHQRKPRKASF